MPSKAATLRAIAASMRHWRRVWEGKDKRIGPEECALCDLDARANQDRMCRACPLDAWGFTCSAGGDPYEAATKMFEDGLAGSPEAAHMWMVLAFIYEAERDARARLDGHSRAAGD